MLVKKSAEGIVLEILEINMWISIIATILKFKLDYATRMHWTT